MASTDLLNTTLAEMYAQGGNLVLTTASRKPLFKNLIDKKRVMKDTVGGTKFERPFGYGSPAKGTLIVGGTEVAPIVRNTITKKYEIEAQRHMIPVQIPNLDLRRNDGKQGIVKLIKQYPVASFTQYQEDVEYWVLTGAYHNSATSVIDSPGFQNFATLNGSVTLANGSRGWLQGAAPASQTGTVQGVAIDSTINHNSQYGQITSFASDGVTTIRTAYNLAAQYGGGKAPDVGFADGVTYSNLMTYITDNVRIVNTGQNLDGKESYDFLLYQNAKVYDCSVNLDPTNASFTGSPALSTSSTTGGILYFINSDYIEVPYLEEMERAPEFRDMIADQDVVVAKMVADWTLIQLRLNAMARVDGGRIP